MAEPSLVEQYLQIGALGVSFLTLIGIVVAWVKSIGPMLGSLKEGLDDLAHESSNNNLILENNTRALETVARSVEEVAKSNQNVASMVHLLTSTLETQVKMIEKHDLEASKRVDEAIKQLRITHEEIIRSVEKNGLGNDKQHADILNALTRHDDRSQRIETEVGRVKGKTELVLTELAHK